MPAIVGICGLGDIRDGQRFGRGHPVRKAEERNGGRAGPMKSEHARELMGCC